MDQPMFLAVVIACFIASLVCIPIYLLGERKICGYKDVYKYLDDNGVVFDLKEAFARRGQKYQFLVQPVVIYFRWEKESKNCLACIQTGNIYLIECPEGDTRLLWEYDKKIARIELHPAERILHFAELQIGPPL